MGGAGNLLQVLSEVTCVWVCGHTVRSVSLNLLGKFKSFKWQRELIPELCPAQKCITWQCTIISRFKKRDQGVVVNDAEPAVAKGSNTSDLSQHRRANHSSLHAQVKVKNHIS